MVPTQEVAKQELLEAWLTRIQPTSGVMDSKDWCHFPNEKGRIGTRNVQDEDAESDDSTVILTDGKKERHQPKDHFLKPRIRRDYILELERRNYGRSDFFRSEDVPREPPKPLIPYSPRWRNSEHGHRCACCNQEVSEERDDVICNLCYEGGFCKEC